MLGILGYFLQVAAGHILYLALHLESGSFPRPLPPERERAAFADLRQDGPAAAAARAWSRFSTSISILRTKGA